MSNFFKDVKEFFGFTEDDQQDPLTHSQTETTNPKIKQE